MLWQLKRTRAQSHPRLLRSVDSQSSMAARIKRFSRDPVELAAQLQELPASEVKTAYSCTRSFSVGFRAPLSLAQECLNAGSRINHMGFHEPGVGSSFGWSCDGIGGSEQQNGNGAKGKDLIGGPSGHRIELVGCTYQQLL